MYDWTNRKVDRKGWLHYRPHHVAISAEHYESSENADYFVGVAAGGAPVDRTLTSLLSKSNQNGAPCDTANPVISQPISATSKPNG